MSYQWGIDLGGTKIEGVVLDPAVPDKPLCRLRLPTEAEIGYDHIRSQILELCRRISRETGLPLPKQIGMGTPGIVDTRTGKLKNSNSQCLNGQRLREDLLADSGIDFVLANDANCLALAEATLGAARGYPTVFGIIMGTGVGGGIIVNGHVLPGCHGIAGEWGQIILEAGGATSKYGTQGTIEAIIAGPALEEFYAKLSGETRRLKEIATRAEAKTDPHAVATIERLTDCFARSLAIIVDVLDPHAIVIGGGVGNIAALYSADTHRKITEAIFNPTFEAALLKPILGDSAGVFGAAMLVKG
jgi:predicted NBD/HSP70 family sugar kinase